MMIESDRELSAMVQELWDNDVNRLKPGKDYQISLQVQQTHTHTHKHIQEHMLNIFWVDILESGALKDLKNCLSDSSLVFFSLVRRGTDPSSYTEFLSHQY